MQRQLTEVIVSAAGPSSAGQGSGTVTLYDLATGSSLFTLKQTFSGLHSTVAIETRDSQGGLVLAAQLDKGLLNVYSYQKVLSMLYYNILSLYNECHRTNYICVLCFLRN